MIELASEFCCSDSVSIHHADLKGIFNLVAGAWVLVWVVLRLLSSLGVFFCLNDVLNAPSRLLVALGRDPGHPLYNPMVYMI